ncbi:hypothetical protein CKO25_09685 [Thiocapsa imhoffii]|uniref:Methyltransferase domain-containing protein n=2 Tax=Thiocapsa imhoffii TaxID=382777 RepID=A0A9X1B9D2_9GAMM|nr:hypothetical protein [Thiocapsa imhoffii]
MGDSDPAVVESATKFYVEQGGAPDTIVEPLFWFDHGEVKRYAEVGCGFGFGIDFAREALGWTVRGFDPSPLAAAGSQLLALPITPDYLGPATWAGEAPFDLLLASEVIEHVADPHRFLADIIPALAPDGWLVLSTPNAAGVHPDSSTAALLQALSPGYHLVLFTETGLRGLLEAHGFRHLTMRVSETTLTVLACREARQGDPARTLDRRLYRAYLERRLHSLPADSSLAHGYASRLIKEDVNAGDLDAAAQTLRTLTETYRRCYGIDLDDPAGIAIEPPSAGSFTRFIAAYPTNLCGLAYRSGFLALHQRQDLHAARAAFELAIRAGEALRMALQSIGSDDGETEHLVDLSRQRVLEISLRLEPEQAAAHLDAARRAEGITEQTSAMMQRGFEQRVEQCFVDLVLSGAYPAASALEAARPCPDADLLEQARTERERIRSALARGLLTLNHAGDATSALPWFRLAHDAAMGQDATDPAAYADLAPTIEMGYVLALTTVEPLEAVRICQGRLASSQSPSAPALGLCREVFQRLVHGGSYKAAARLEPALKRALIDEPELGTPDLHLALGLFLLNYEADPQRALHDLERAAAMAAPRTPAAELAVFHIGVANSQLGLESEMLEGPGAEANPRAGGLES